MTKIPLPHPESTPDFKIGERFNPYRLFTGLFIPEALARNPGISPTAKLAYGRLARYAGADGRCFPAVGTLATEIGVKERRAQQCLGELERRGLIRREFQGGRTTEYSFLWHSIFHELPGEQARGVQDRAPLPLQDSAPRGVQDRAPKESQFKRVNESESSSAAAEMQLQPKTDDDPLFHEGQNQNPSVAIVADCLRAAVDAWGIPTPAGKIPDREIAEMLEKAGLTVENLAYFLRDEFRGKRGGNPATWRYVQKSVQHWVNDPETQAAIRSRLLFEEEARRAQERAEAVALEEKAREEAARVPVSPADAVWAVVRSGVPVPRIIQRRLERIGADISAADVAKMARAYRECVKCYDSGLMGLAIDKTRRFCDCMAGEEKRHQDPDGPEREIERAHASLKGKMAAAAASKNWGFVADAIEESAISETDDEIVINVVPRWRLCLESSSGKPSVDLLRLLELMGEKRPVRFARVAQVEPKPLPPLPKPITAADFAPLMRQAATA